MEWTELIWPDNIYHQFSSPDESNRKFISRDGRREIVFDKYGNLVTDPRDIGSYNTGNTWLRHILFDVIPYVVMGDTKADTTTFRQRLRVTIVSLYYVLWSWIGPGPAGGAEG